MPAEAWRVFAEAGVNLDKPLLVAYPLASYLAILELCARHPFPGEPEQAALKKIGRRWVDGFSLTFRGKAIQAMGAGDRPAADAHAGGANVSQREQPSRDRGDRARAQRVRVHPAAGQTPGWYEGILERGLEIAGAKEPRLALEKLEAGEARFAVSWS